MQSSDRPIACEARLTARVPCDTGGHQQIQLDDGIALSSTYILPNLEQLFRPCRFSRLHDGDLCCQWTD